MKESDIYKKLKKFFYPHGEIIPIETSTIVGIPDLYYFTYDGYQGWIELKVIQSDNYKIQYRPGQKARLNKLKLSKINVFVLVYSKSSRMYFLIYTFFDKIKECEIIWNNSKLNNSFLSYLKSKK